MREQIIEEMARTAIEALPIFNAKNYNVVYKMCEALYNAGYRKQEWISVEERLPTQNTYVLVCQGNYFGQPMNVYAYLGDDKWEDEQGYIDYTENNLITHWQPLPQPPKMRGEDDELAK